MPPPRRKKAKKNGSIETNGKTHVDACDDKSNIKKPFRRFKASNAARRELRSNSKSLIDDKHVGMERKNSSSPEMGNKLSSSILIDSESESDIEMDIGPPNRNYHNTRSKDGETVEPAVKRQKPCDESMSKKRNASKETTPIVSDEPIVENESNTKSTESNVLNNEQTPGYDSEELDFELGIESDIEKQIEFDPKHKPTETTEVAATEQENGATTEIEGGAEAASKEVAQNETEARKSNDNETTEAEIENALIEKELDGGCGDEQETADDDCLSLSPKDDEIFSDYENNTESPVTTTRKTGLMNIPKWKQAELEKDKSGETKKVELKKPEPNKANGTFLLNRIVHTATGASTTTSIKVISTASAPSAAPASASSTSTVKKPAPGGKSIFTIPLQVQQPTIRDPRLAKTITDTNAENVPNNADSSQATQSSNQGASMPNTNAVERKSVKERLGTRFLFSNLRNTTSFVIPNNMQLTAAESASMADRINQPIASITIPTPRPNPQNFNRQNVAPAMGAPLIRQRTPPPFARKSQNVEKSELIIPSFAIGAQQYEPVFTYLFKTTCRRYMHDTCSKPDCQLEHRLPDHVLFRKEIDKMFQASIIELYEIFMCRNQKLFDFYFDDFCHYFGKNMLVDNLKQMVDDCAERKSPFHFTSIIEGLMLTGRSFTRGLAELIPEIHCRKIKTSKEIMKLILSPRIENIDPFVKVIDSIRQQDNFKFSTEWINRLLIIHSQKKKVNADLNNTIFQLISGLDQKIASRALDQELFAKFIDAYGKSQLAANES